MPSQSTLNLATLDFDEVKANLKSFLKSQDKFKDYNFEGSNMSVLMDLLAYNTFLNGFYLNMIASEMFLDSAQLRDSVISHAKELNYIPRSFRSSRAEIDLFVYPSTNNVLNVTIPKGTSFSSRNGSNVFSFVTQENIVITDKNANGAFFTQKLPIFEGTYVTDQFVMDYSLPVQRFLLSNPTIDISSILVTVTENAGSNTIIYSQAESLFNVGATSSVYFLQPAEGDRYEILFGDNTYGRKPVNGAAVLAEYRISSGELPNGCRVFVNDGNIDGHANVQIITRTSANRGGVAENTNEIRFNAPRHFQTQERAVTASDYETLLIKNYPEIQAIAVYGGEEATPQQYGKVFLSIDIKDADGIPDSKKAEYIAFLKPRTPVSIEPIFIDPEFTFARVETTVKYNFTTTSLSPNDIKTQVVGVIEQYNIGNLSDFKVKLRNSKLLEEINNAHPSIVSATCDLKLIKKYRPTLNTGGLTFTINFGTALNNTYSALPENHSDLLRKALTSSRFTYEGKKCTLEDDGAGSVRIVFTENAVTKTVAVIGDIDYATGRVNIRNFNISQLEGDDLKIIAEPLEKDIETGQNIILEIKTEDIIVTVNAVRE